MGHRRVVGIDLAGHEKRPTGWAYLRGPYLAVTTLHTDDEIIRRIRRLKPDLIAIDAPLNLPRKGSALREADIEMRKRGYPVLPPLFPGMRSLTYRAIRLNERFKAKNLRVIEVHPESTRKALDLPKRRDLLVRAFGVMGLVIKKPGPEKLTPHEVDAILAALTALLRLRRRTEAIGHRITVPKRLSWIHIHV
ncbi:MAG: DUF429 domain-containing protein [Candidatus Bathyarchaeia archaeon]